MSHLDKFAQRMMVRDGHPEHWSKMLDRGLFTDHIAQRRLAMTGDHIHRSKLAKMPNLDRSVTDELAYYNGSFANDDLYHYHKDNLSPYAVHKVSENGTKETLDHISQRNDLNLDTTHVLVVRRPKDKEMVKRFIQKYPGHYHTMRTIETMHPEMKEEVKNKEIELMHKYHAEKMKKKNVTS